MGAFTNYINKNKKETTGAFSNYVSNKEKPKADIGNQFISAERQAYVAPTINSNLATTKPFTSIFNELQPNQFDSSIPKINQPTYSTASKLAPVVVNPHYATTPTESAFDPKSALLNKSFSDITGNQDLKNITMAGVGQANIGNLNAINELLTNKYSPINTFGQLNPVSLGIKAVEGISNAIGKPIDIKDPLYEKGGFVPNLLTKEVGKEEISTQNYQQKALEGKENVGKIISQGLMSIPAMAPSLATGSMAPMAVSAFGSGAREAEQGGASDLERIAYGAQVAALELATEALPFAKLKSIWKGVDNPLKSMILQASEEFIGESLSEALNPFIKRATYDKDAELATINSVLDSGLTGVAMAIMLGGAGLGVNSYNNALANPTKENIIDVANEIQQVTGVDMTKAINSVMADPKISEATTDILSTLPKQPTQSITEPVKVADMGLQQPTEGSFTKYINTGTQQPTMKEVYYHGSPSEFETISNDNTGGLINLTSSFDTAYKYASGGGGGRVNLYDTEKYAISHDGDVFEFDESKNLWKHIGYDGSEGEGIVNVVPSNKQLNTMTTNELKNEINNGFFGIVNKRPNIKKVYPNIKNTLDLTNDANISILANLDSYGDRNATMIIEKAREGRFDWFDTKYEASNRVWENVINPQLEKLGYDSIKFFDDNGPNNPTVAVFSEKNINYTPIEVKPTKVVKEESIADKQLKIIQESNPAPNEQNTWIRSTNDIKSPENAFINTDLDENYLYPDFTEEMGRKAVDSGKIKIYSSYPIENGAFVTPSKMQAEDYAGGGKIYEKTVGINDVAWINSDEGQFAKVTDTTQATTSPIQPLLAPTDTNMLPNQSMLNNVQDNQLNDRLRIFSTMIDKSLRKGTAKGTVSFVPNEIRELGGYAQLENSVNRILSGGKRTVTDERVIDYVMNSNEITKTLKLDNEAIALELSDKAEMDSLLDEFSKVAAKATDTNIDEVMKYMIDYDNVADLKKAIKEVSQITSLENSLTKDNAQETIAKLEELKSSPLIKLNLQMFASRIDTLIDRAKAMYTEIGGKEKLLSFPQGRLLNLREDIKALTDKAPLTYKEINNVDTLAKAKELIAQYPEAAKALITSEDNYNNAIETTVGMTLIEDMFKQARINENLYDEVFSLAEQHAQKLKNMGQSIQATSMWSRATPEGMVKYIDKVIEDFKKQGLDIKLPKDFKKQIYEDMVAIEQMDTVSDSVEYIKKLHKDRTGKNIKDFVETNLSDKTTEKLREIATDQVMLKIINLADSSIWKKISTYQAISHLLNTKTGGRNILSNLTMNEAERVVNTLAIPADMLLSKFTNQRSLAMPTKRIETLKPALNKAKDAATRIELGLALEGNKYNVGQTFKKGPLSKAEKALRYELEVTDEFQKGAIEADIRDQFKRLNNGKELTEVQERIVQEEMKYRTFQDDTLISKLLTEQKNTLNRIGFGKQQKGTGIKVNGKEYFGVREFGAGDLVIKYTKVAGNIISRKLEYTPLGYIKVLTNMSRVLSGDLQAQRQVANSFARATTGASMMGMGALLKALGLIIRQDDDKKASQAALEKAAGLGAYKFNVSGALRLLSGGNPKLQEGDSLATYGWIEPIGSSFTIGAAIYDKSKKNGTTSEIALDALNQTLEESLDISTLSMIKSMTYAQTPIDVLITPLASNVSGFIPSPVRQAAGIIDPVMRSKYSGGPVERSIKQLIGSLPFASKTIEPYLSPVGQERTNNTGLGGLLLSQLSPATVTKYEPSPILEPLLSLTSAAQEYDIDSIPWPSLKAPNTLKIDGKLITLTDEQKTLYLEKKGKYTEKEFEKKLPTYFSSKTEQQLKDLIDELNEILSNSIDVGKDAID